MSDAVLALRLAAPMQSWGGHSSFNRRDTRSEPTKSGVVGLLAAAGGVRRGDPISHLLDLRLGVRADQPGTLLRDYHTAGDYRGGGLPTAVVNAKGVQKLNPDKETHITERFYLQDAVFVAALAGPADVLDSLAADLRNPRFPLSLGRRSCPPTGPVCLGTFATGLDETLQALPWQAAEHHKRRYRHAATVRLPATIEDPAGQDTAWDVPSSFSLRARTFAARVVRHEWITLPTGAAAAVGRPALTHDPFGLLEA